jgi:hypothetical protein
MPNSGWECPGCGRCYAPFVAECWTCNNRMVQSSSTYIAPAVASTREGEGAKPSATTAAGAKESNKDGK